MSVEKEGIYGYRQKKGEAPYVGGVEVGSE
jgi:hypothetical protein